jgi:hypothetical protein
VGGYELSLQKERRRCCHSGLLSGIAATLLVGLLLTQKHKINSKAVIKIVNHPIKLVVKRKAPQKRFNIKPNLTDEKTSTSSD